MNFSGIKSKIIVKKTENLLKNRDKKSSINISSIISSVGIVVDQGSKFNFDLLKKLQKEIASGSNNFHVLTCKNDTDGYNEFRGISYFEKDISWNGTIKSKELITFLDKPFDMLIDYTKANTIFKKYLVSKSKAKFKVGYPNVDDRLYDFMIGVESEAISSFNNELIKYLKILKKL